MRESFSPYHSITERGVSEVNIGLTLQKILRTLPSISCDVSHQITATSTLYGTVPQFTITVVYRIGYD